MKNHPFLILLILLTAAGGTGAYLTITKLKLDKADDIQFHTTRFYVQNESQIVSGKPVDFRIILENQEAKSIEYKLKVRIAGEEIYSKDIPLPANETFNQTITITPKTANGYLRFEFRIMKNNETYRTRVFQVSPIIDNSMAQDLSNESKKEESKYNLEKNGDLLIYIFNSGEKLILKNSGGKVNIGDAVYTSAKKNEIQVFVGESYERLIPDLANFLLPVLLEVKDVKIKVNEGYKLQNGYSVNLLSIEDKMARVNIIQDGRVVRDFKSTENSTMEYWMKFKYFGRIDDFKKQKAILIKTRKVNMSDVTVDIKQYGDQKSIVIGNTYSEFRVTDITSDTIIMKNTDAITIEPGTEIMLMKGAIRIKV